MDRYLILKNGLVLTLDNEDRVGYYNVVIKNNIIHSIDYFNDLTSDRNIYTKYPGVNIIDAKDKIIIPSFINSNINSSYSLSNIFFERLNYDKLSDNLSLVLLEKYFTSAVNRADLKNLITFSYFRALSNGELFLNETSEFISKDFLQEFHKYNFLIVQDIIFTSFSEAFSRYLNEIKKFHCLGIRDEADITSYSLSSAAKALKDGKKKIFFEILHKSDSQEHIRKTFSKSIFKILGENQFLDDRFIFSNPINIQKDELDYISHKKVNIVLCPTDVIKLGDKRIEGLDIMKYGLNVSLGTGYLGSSILSEMKLLSHLAKKGNISYRSLLKMSITNPCKMFGLSDTFGSIEKNKIANLLLFDVSDLRNYLMCPDVTSEKISEHIIDNLDSKDISDIIVKGNVIRRDYRSKLFDTDNLKQNTTALMNKIVEVGKYYEFKEKYLMRKRIKDISTNNKEEKKIIVSTGNRYENENLEDKVFTNESEFKIIGLRKNTTPISNIIDDDDFIDYDKHIIELDDVFDGFKMYDDTELNIANNAANENQNTATPKKKIFFDDTGSSVGKTEEIEEKSDLKFIIQDKLVEDDSTDDIEKKADEKSVKPSKTKKDKIKKDKKPVVYKKDKLRFGFSDNEE